MLEILSMTLLSIKFIYLLYTKFNQSLNLSIVVKVHLNYVIQFIHQ